MGHVNNAVFFRYLEQARIEWYSHIGRGENAGLETVVVHCYCTYYAPLAYPGEIEIRTYAGSPGRSSFDIVQEIRRSDAPDTICAIGGSKVVWVDPKTGKSTAGNVLFFLPGKRFYIRAKKKLFCRNAVTI